MKYRYMLKDIRRQLILDRETYFEFGPRIMCYFEWNKKTLEDIARQKTISIDTCVRKVGVKHEDIAAYPFRRLTNEARTAVMSAFNLTDQEVRSAECTIRTCGAILCNSVKQNYWVMDVMTADKQMHPVVLVGGDVTYEDEKPWRTA